MGTGHNLKSLQTIFPEICRLAPLFYTHSSTVGKLAIETLQPDALYRSDFRINRRVHRCKLMLVGCWNWTHLKCMSLSYHMISSGVSESGEGHFGVTINVGDGWDKTRRACGRIFISLHQFIIHNIVILTYWPSLQVYQLCSDPSF